MRYLLLSLFNHQETATRRGADPDDEAYFKGSQPFLALGGPLVPLE